MKTEQNWRMTNAYEEDFAAWLDRNEKNHKSRKIFTLLFGKSLEEYYQPIRLKMGNKKR